MTPLNPTNTSVCPGAPRARPVTREAPWHRRDRLYLPPSVVRTASRHILNAAAVVVTDEPLLPRALFAHDPSRGARMVRAALQMDKPRKPPVALETFDDDDADDF